MARIRHTTPRHQAPIFDWIPARYHDAILADTSTQDVSSYVTAAINECGDYELVCERGRYCIGSTVVMTNAAKIAGRGATFRALSSLDTANGRGSIMRYVGASAPRFERLTFDCNSQSCSGLFIVGAVRAKLKETNFLGTVAGFAGLRAAGCLYVSLDECYFTGLGRSIDAQKGWEYWRTYMTGAPTLTFNAGARTITRSSGSWITDGFQANESIKLELTASNNLGHAKISSVTATVLTMDPAVTLVNEGPVSGALCTQLPSAYYGLHHSRADHCVFGAREGARVLGKFTFSHTDHEHGVNAPGLRNETNTSGGVPRAAAIVVGEELSGAQQHRYIFDSIYTEISQGSANTIAIWSADTGNVGYFDACELNGATATEVGSVAIKNLFGPGTRGCGLIKAFEYAFEGAWTGTGHHMLYDASGWSVPNDIGLFKAGSGQQIGETPRAMGGWTDRYFDITKGLFQGPNDRFGIATVTPDTSTNRIDLASARHFKVSRAAGAITLTTAHLVNVASGQRFTIEAGDNNITLSGTDFGIPGGNRTLATGETYEGVVRSDGTIRQAGV